MTLTLGIDPGSRDGAAVLLQDDGRTVQWWVAWWTLKRSTGPQMIVAFSKGGRQEWNQLSHPIGAAVWPTESYDLVCEQLFAVPGRRSSSPKSLITLAEATGAAMEAARMYALSERRVLARDWRPLVLGLPVRMKAADAEAFAVEHAPRLFGWWDWGEVEALPKRARGAVAEAACIARWGVVTS